MGIVIAENNRVAARLLEMQLAAMGHETITVGSGSEVLELLRARSDVELLITDLCMPGMDGIELIRAIRRDPVWCRLPIVVATGVVDLQNAREVASLGVHHYLVKPVRRAELESTVRAALAEREVALVSPDEVMQRLGVDAAGFQMLVDSFLSIVDDAIGRLRDVPVDGQIPDGLPLRDLQEAASLLEVTPLQELVGRIEKSDGAGRMDDPADLERLSVLLNMLAGSLRNERDGSASRSGTA